MMTVPSVRQTAPNFRPIRGLTRGMGDDYTDPTDPTTTIGDPTVTDLPDQPLLPPISLNLGPPLSSSPPPLTPSEVAQGQYNNLITSGDTSTNTSGQSAAQLLAAIAQAGAAGSAIYKSTQSPSLVAGTGLVYNPATGQLVNASGVLPTAATSSISSLLPLLLIGGAILLISGMGKR